MAGLFGVWADGDCLGEDTMTANESLNSIIADLELVEETPENASDLREAISLLMGIVE